MSETNELEHILAQRIGKTTIGQLVGRVESDKAFRERLWKCVGSANRRISVNALWVMTHLTERGEWLSARRNELTDILLKSDDVSTKRNILNILCGQEYSAEEIRGDLLDFCLAKITAECEPYAIRAYCINLAFKMCRHYPELVSELEILLEMISQQLLSPGLKSAVRQTKTKIRQLR